MDPLTIVFWNFRQIVLLSFDHVNILKVSLNFRDYPIAKIAIKDRE